MASLEAVQFVSRILIADFGGSYCDNCNIQQHAVIVHRNLTAYLRGPKYEVD